MKMRSRGTDPFNVKTDLLKWLINYFNFKQETLQNRSLDSFSVLKVFSQPNCMHDIEMWRGLLCN